MVLFDLPVTTPKERKAATKFRSDLQDLGFEMAQFSVYMKWCSGYDKADTLILKIKQLTPESGRISVLCFTDKQFSQMVTIHGGKRTKNKTPDQFELF